MALGGREAAVVTDRFSYFWTAGRGLVIKSDAVAGMENKGAGSDIANSFVGVTILTRC